LLSAGIINDQIRAVVAGRVGISNRSFESFASDCGEGEEIKIAGSVDGSDFCLTTGDGATSGSSC
jgi:hypothetical protein